MANITGTTGNDVHQPDPVISISPPEISLAEGDADTTEYRFTVSRTDDSTTSFVRVAFDQGDTNANDFGGTLPDETVDIFFELGSLSQDIPIEVSGDKLVEDDESFTLSLINVAGATIDENANSATGVITNDDVEVPDPVISISPPEISLAEGDADTTEYRFTVSRTDDSTTSFVRVAFDQGDTNANDFGGTLPDETVDIFFELGSLSQDIPIEVSGDKLVEDDESFTLSLINVAGATIDENANSATGVITNDDVEVPTGNIQGTAGDDIIIPGDVSDGVTGGEPSEADDTIDALGGNDIVSGGGGADTIEGGGGNDVLLGGADDDTLTDSEFGNDTLAGGQGNDTLDGGKGDDILDGGTGDDTLDGGIGFDTLLGGADNDILRGGDAADTLQGEAGDDTLEGGEGNDTLLGGDGEDTLSDSSGQNTLDGGAGNDTLTGGPGVDIYRFAGDNGADRITAFGFGGDVIDLSAYGLAGLDDFVIEQQDADTVIFGYDNPDNTNTGNTITLENVDPSRLGPEDFIFEADANVIAGTANPDDLPGTAGPDVIKALAGDDTVTGAGGNDVLDGAGGNDTLEGGAGNDVLAGGNGVDTLNGGAGNDALRGEGGADTLDGGAGDDRLEGGGSQQADVFVFAGANGADTITDFEDGFDRIDFTAYDVSSVSDFDIDPDGSGNTIISGYDGEGNTITLQNVTAANLGDDDFIFSAPPTPGAITGTAGDDIIIPDHVSDGVTGGEPSEADDTIDALGGNDIVSGGGGADSITGGADNDTLIGGTGNDVLDGGEGDDDLVGGQGNDTLIGGSGYDDFDGGAGADTADFSSFELGVIVDLLDTRRADGPDGDEPLSGIENIIGTEFNDAIEGDNNPNTLRGNAGNDNIFGYAGSDFLDGGADADTLYGGDGNDILDGGTGPDLLNGEEGDDTFVFTGDNGRDRINFFDHNHDLIDLRDYEEVSSIDDLTISQDGPNTVISGYNGEGNIITLSDFDSGFLSSSGSEFLFGDDVKPPDVSIVPNSPIRQNEGDSGTTSFFFTVTRSGSQPDLNQATSVNWDVKPGAESATQGAAAPDDFVSGSFPSGVLEWEAGDDEAKTITVEVQGDTVFEPDEGFSVRLSRPQNATIVQRESDGTIVNDDPEPPADGNSIYISDVQIDEGNDGSTTEAVFEVSLSTPVAETVTVDFATEDGTATAGTDYTAVDGTLTFDPGVTEQEVRVPITGDAAIEPNESFFVNLSNPVNDVIADGRGQATIVDDDGDALNAPGTSTDEVFDGSDGDDVLQGSDGDDALSGAAGDDALTGGAGDDALDGGAGDDILAGGSGDDTLDGGGDDDVLGGGSGNDELQGGAGNDTLAGGSGDDQLSGGTGNDTLFGGSGYDSFVFTAADDDSGQDTIRMFNADEDTLAFEDYGESLNAFSDLDTNTNGVLDDGDANVSVDAGNTVIDLGGQTDGAIAGTLTLVGVTGLEADDLAFS